jgi:hypothetical protein
VAPDAERLEQTTGDAAAVFLVRNPDYTVRPRMRFGAAHWADADRRIGL